MKAADIYRKLEEYFKPSECTDYFNKMGIQYHNSKYIKKVYTSTFASNEAISKVLQKKEKNVMIFSHHPAPPRPNENLPYPQISEDIVKKMEDSEVSLFSYHIPLDRNNPYSPSNTLAKALGLKPYDIFYKQYGVYMGVLSKSDFKNIIELKYEIEKLFNHEISFHDYGDRELINGKVAIMAGCAKKTDIYEYLKNREVNTLITGVTNPAISWVPPIHQEARINRINILGGTHYSTEKFALKALVKFFEEIGIIAEFIEEMPNLLDI